MTYDQKNKMKPAFRTFEGGLFAEVEKADVGDGFERLQENGVDMMSWADPLIHAGCCCPSAYQTSRAERDE